MLDILNKLHRDPSRNIPQYKVPLQNLVDKYDLRLARFHDVPVNDTEGQRLLRHIIDYNLPNYYTDNNKDISLFINTIEPQRDTIKSLYDTVHNKRMFKNTFTSNVNNKPFELITPLHMENPMLQLPIEKDYSHWDNIHPVKLLQSYSLILPVEMNGMMFEYVNPDIKYITFGIDTSVLMMKYIKFYRENKDKDDPIYEFIKHDIYGYLFKNNLTNWILNIMEMCILETDTEFIFSRVDGLQPTELVVGNTWKKAIQSMCDEIELVKNNNISVTAFMNTNWFPDNKTVFNLIEERLLNYNIPTRRQYDGMTFLNEISLVRVYLLLVSQCINKSKYTKDTKKLEYQLQRIQRLKPWKYFDNDMIKKDIQKRLENTLYLCGLVLS